MKLYTTYFVCFVDRFSLDDADRSINQLSKQRVHALQVLFVTLMMCGECNGDKNCNPGSQAFRRAQHCQQLGNDCRRGKHTQHTAPACTPEGDGVWDGKFGGGGRSTGPKHCVRRRITGVSLENTKLSVVVARDVGCVM